MGDPGGAGDDRLTARRLLYLANESTAGAQRGPRQAFDSLVADGALDEVDVFPFPAEAAAHGATAARRRLLERAERSRPHLVLWSHVADFPVTPDDLRRLRALPSAPLLCFVDIDAWGRWSKPLTRSTRLLAGAADVVVLSAGGSVADLFRRAGAADIRHLVNTYDVGRFGTGSGPEGPRRFDAVMIGNRLTSRLPGRRLPGARQRERLARCLGRRLGDRFGLFGHGWDGFAGHRGPVPFDQQGDVNRSAWVAVGWDHFPGTPGYFSNRLPIALASGTPYVGNEVPGLDLLLPPDSGVLTAPTPDAAVELVDELLRRPRDELVELGRRAAAVARRHLCQQDHYRRLVQDLAAERARRLCPAASA